MSNDQDTPTLEIKNIVDVEDVKENIGTEIADMRIIIHRGSAGVHLDFSGLVGNQFVLASGQGIVDQHDSVSSFSMSSGSVCRNGASKP